MLQVKKFPYLYKKKIIFLFPLVYRPQKVNFAERFLLLSKWYDGHIFSLSGGKQRDLCVSDFLFFSDKSAENRVVNLLRGIWIQVFLPIKLLWKKVQIDALIAYDPYRSGLSALILKYVFRTKMIVELNGDYHRIATGRGYISKVLMRLSFRFILQVADAIKVLNKDQEDFCRQLLPNKPIYRFPDFVATKYFQSLESFNGNYLLSVGQPFDIKGMDLLIEAFLRIAEKHKEISLRIMGYCPQADLAKYKAISLGHPRIIFIPPGWIEDVGEQMKNCFALVNAARSEAMGRVHIEAMACGKPIVSTRTNGGMQCVEDGLTGLLCKINDAGDLAAKLDELLSNPQRAQQMGQAGMVRMQERFSETLYVETFHKMLEEVIGL